eukprot:1140738-Pelagomonas_calceolata.AAC.2
MDDPACIVDAHPAVHTSCLHSGCSSHGTCGRCTYALTLGGLGGVCTHLRAHGLTLGDVWALHICTHLGGLRGRMHSP